MELNVDLKARFRSAGLLIGGTVEGQGLIALSMPLMTRLYTPSDFTTLAVYVSIMGILSVMASLRFNLAIPLPEKMEEAAALLFLALASTIVLSILSALAVLILYNTPVWNLVNGINSHFIWLVPLGVLAIGTYTGVQYWAIRNKEFSLIAKTKVARAIVSIIVQLIASLFTPNALGLLLGHLFHMSTGFISILSSILKKELKYFSNLTSVEIKNTLSKYKKFPLISTPEALFDAAYQHLPMLLISTMLFDHTAGQLLLAMSIVGLPVGLLGNAISSIYLSEARKARENNNLGSITIKILFILLLVGIVILVPIGCVSPFLFPIIFGEEWKGAGIMVLWMTPWFILQLAVAPVSVLFQVIGAQFFALRLQALGSIIVIGAVYYAIQYEKADVVAYYSVASFIFYIIYLFSILIKASQLDGSLYKCAE